MDKKDGVQARGVHQQEEEGDRCLLHWEAAHPCSEYPPIMTAIKATPTDKASAQDGVRSAPVPDIPPSALEEEAKTRLVSALSKGVHTLVERGHGRERASTELLNEIADGCAPDEEEVGHSVCLLFSRGRGRRGCGLGANTFCRLARPIPAPPSQTKQAVLASDPVDALGRMHNTNHPCFCCS